MKVIAILSAILAACFLVQSLLQQSYISIGLLLFFLAVPLFFRFSVETILKIMIAVVFFVPIQHVRFLNIFNVMNPLTLFAVLLWFKTIWNLAYERKKNYLARTGPVDLLYLFFLVSALLSTYFAESRFGALNWIFYSVFTGFLVYKTVSQFEREAILRILRFLVVMACICAVEGIAESIFKRSLVLGITDGRLSSLLGHPLVNGLIFSSLFPISLVFWLKMESKFFMVTTLVLLIAIFLTFSRGSWICLMVGLLFMIYGQSRELRSKLLRMALILGIFMFVVPFIREPLAKRINRDETKDNSSFNVRFRSLPIAFKALKEKPVLGFGPYNSVRTKDQRATSLAIRKTSYENSYLGLLLDLGIVGFTLGVLIFLVILKNSLYFVRKDEILVAVVAGFIVFLLNMATFNFDAYRIFHFVIWLFAGCLTGLYYRQIVKTAPPGKRNNNHG